MYLVVLLLCAFALFANGQVPLPLPFLTANYTGKVETEGQTFSTSGVYYLAFDMEEGLARTRTSAVISDTTHNYTVESLYFAYQGKTESYTIIGGQCQVQRGEINSTQYEACLNVTWSKGIFRGKIVTTSTTDCSIQQQGIVVHLHTEAYFSKDKKQIFGFAEEVTSDTIKTVVETTFTNQNNDPVPDKVFDVPPIC
eukprot:TRINITY_DN795_c0_g1_i1.p1 TRINITY_DN795_c0_g1~~TRINITY_DN795_c0_g1_i1.p1  ORF type:complete len:197 (+),score=28.87 TRINITY_DN795_c0_g1_i1:167-757(+)